MPFDYDHNLEHSNPAPLIVDKMAALPPGSKERGFYENFLNTLKGKAANVGDGFDSMSRESYKATHRVLKSSALISENTDLTPPKADQMPTSDQIVGEEEGALVSNLQSWKVHLTNAVVPISDAVGSHADTAHSVTKGPMGAAQALPTSVSAAVDSINPQFVNELDAHHKAVKADGMQNLPSKAMGSIRHLSTAADKMLSGPFELLSDVYGGLMKIMDMISKLIDGLMSFVTNFVIGVAGGLINAMVPPGLTTALMKGLSMATKNIGGLTQQLGGFSAVGNITSQMGGLTKGFSSGLGNPASLAASYAPKALGGGLSGGLGKLGGLSGGLSGGLGKLGGLSGGLSGGLGKLGGLSGTLSGGGSKLGALTKLGGAKGVGNLGGMLGGGFSGGLGGMASKIRDPGQIMSGLLPPELSKQMGNLNKIPGLSMVGNLGFSVGNIMDSLGDKAFAKSLDKYACHASIIGPLFNKQAPPNGSSFATEDVPATFQNSQFVPGAQGNKGSTMLGPGSTVSQKAFGLF